MKLLITGGAGFIGSAVVRVALDRGMSVVNVDKLSYAANPANLTPWNERDAYAFVKADICDAEAMEKVFREHQPDAVAHLAAESHVDRSIDGPSAFIESNILGTFTLLQAARAYYADLPGERSERFRFLHVSTDEVFGALGEEGLFSEETPYRPNSPYSASKASSDLLVRAWGETFGLPVVTTHCSNNYGPYQHLEKLIPVTIVAALAGRPIPVYGKGENVRDWLYVDDHAEALLLLLEKGRQGETYNVGGGNERRNIELVQCLCDLMDELAPAERPRRELISFVADRPGHDLRYAIDASKIEGEFGWRPSVDFETGMRRTVEWYLANEWWWRGVQQRGHTDERLGLGRDDDE